MILFFDTETTGIPRNYNAPVNDVDNWPRLVQIGWILYDSQDIAEMIEMVIIPDGFEIPEVASAVHGLTTATATETGIDLQACLTLFTAACAKADAIAGHNVSFDLNVIGAEYVRCGLPIPTEGKRIIDTMKESTAFCAIPGPYGNKWPKLHELYLKLFEQDMGHAHTALADIQNTAKCYFKLSELGVFTA